MIPQVRGWDGAWVIQLLSLHCASSEVGSPLHSSFLYRVGAFVALGLAIIGAGLLLATLVWYLTGFEWVLIAVLLLVFGAFGLVALAGTGGSRPPVMSHWDAYAEMSGRQAGGGSLLDMMRPHQIDSNLGLLTNAALPFIVAVALLLGYSLLY